MKKVTGNKNLFKVNLLTADEQVYVGIDVHKKSYSAAVCCNGEIVRTTTMPASNEKVLKFLEPMRHAVRQVVYEAGPTGYSLARALESAGFWAGVAAPSKTPRTNGDNDKSDRLDSRQLALFASKGLLKFVAVPTIDQEYDRQIRRLREQLSGKLKRIKQQIKSFLLQHGIEPPHGLAIWSKSAVLELTRMQLENRLRYVLDRFMDELDYLRGQLLQVESKIKEVFGTDTHKAVMAVLDAHRGVDIITASHLVAELYEPRRFSNGREVAKYLGLSPRVRQSGGTRREGPICKTGRRTLRANLIQAAWIWIRYEQEARQLFYKLVHSTGHVNKAITAVARRLGIRLWRLMCSVA